jgi:hypothetical protein
VKKLITSISIALIMAITLGLIALEAHHHSKYGDFFPLGLHADVTDFKADIGSGTATFFDAHLTNFGLYPQEIERCEFISDANAHEVSVAYTESSGSRVKRTAGKPFPIMCGTFVRRILWRLRKPSSSQRRCGLVRLFQRVQKLRRIVPFRTGT